MIIELSSAAQADRARVLETDIRVAASIHEAGHAFAARLCIGEMPELLMPSVIHRDEAYICDGNATTIVNAVNLSHDQHELIIMSGYCNEYLFQDEIAMRAGEHSYVHADKAINDFIEYAKLYNRSDLILMLNGDNTSKDAAIEIIDKLAFRKNFDALKPHRTDLIRLANSIYNRWNSHGFERIYFRPEF